MKCIWMCGGFEPGGDGVGDYVRRVVAALGSLGHAESAVIALRDGAVAEPAESDAVLRLPAAWRLQATIAGAWRFLNRSQPDVLAWNFVPQMFGLRGIIPSSTADAYAQLRGDYPLILFLHELWCGTGREDTLRNWMTGAVQRRGVLYWLERHRPDCVLTSNAAYAAVLDHCGVKSSVVPLCSNIPRQGGVDRRRWPAALAMESFAEEERGEWILGGVFGAIHSVWHPEAALSDLRNHARTTGRKLAMVWFGRASPESELRWRQLAAALEPDVIFVRKGVLNEAIASELIECCDVGFPTIQYNLLGKSGTAAAFLEHGVPLMVVSDDWSPRRSGFERAASPDGVALWNGMTELDWEKLLTSRPRLGGDFAACIDGWRRALASVKKPLPVSSSH